MMTATKEASSPPAATTTATNRTGMAHQRSFMKYEL